MTIPDLNDQEREVRLEEAVRRMIAVTELPGTRSELSAETERAKSFARAALAAGEREHATIAERNAMLDRLERG